LSGETVALIDRQEVLDRKHERERILLALRERPNGATVDDLAAMLGVSQDKLRPRISFLKNKNLIRKIGHRLTPAGDRTSVYVASDTNG
jgi:predicted transcriptional regulator